MSTARPTRSSACNPGLADPVHVAPSAWPGEALLIAGAKEIARIAGESIAEAVDRAVTESLERLLTRGNRKTLARRLFIGEQYSRCP